MKYLLIAVLIVINGFIGFLLCVTFWAMINLDHKTILQTNSDIGSVLLLLIIFSILISVIKNTWQKII